MNTPRLAFFVVGWFLIEVLPVRADTIYVANYLGSNVEAFASTGHPIGHFANLPYPTRMARDNWGNLYVHRAGTSWIDKLSPGGVLIKRLVFSQRSVFNDPGPMACDPYGYLYVVNLGTDVLEEFSPSGIDLGTISYSGIDSATGMTSDAYGNLYVANTTGIERFYFGTDEGEIISGVVGVSGMACDGSGDLYVAIPGLGTIEEYSSSGTDYGAFAYTSFDAEGLAVDSNYFLYALNAGSATIEQFMPNGYDLGVLTSRGMNEPVAIVIGLSPREVDAEFGAQGGTFMSFFSNNADFVSLGLSTTGKFTGAVFIDDVRYPVGGAFDNNGYYEGYFDGGQKSIVLNLDMTDSETNVGNYEVTGSIDGQPVTIYHAAYAAGQKATEAGTYSATLSLSSPIAGGPTSGGTATFSVNTKGGAIITGKLPDGSRFSVAGILVGGSGGNEFLINEQLVYPYATVRGVKGFLTGTLTFQALPNVGGTLEWKKPEQSKGTYPSAIDTNLNVSGSR